MPESNADIEVRVKACVAFIRTAEKPNIARIARSFHAPEQRVRRRLQGRPDRSHSGGRNKKLTDAQELALCRYLDRLDELDISLSRSDLYRTAQRILSETSLTSHLRHSSISTSWPLRFLKRFPQYYVRKRKPIADARKQTHNPTIIAEWFGRLRKAILQYNILPEDFYNMDETGYRIGCGRATKVITRRQHTRLYSNDPDNRDHVTGIECIAASGHVLPCAVVLRAAYILEKHVVPTLHGDTLLAVSETGYANDEIHLDWIRYFNLRTQARQVGVYRLLVIDSASHHLSWDLWQYCVARNIILFTFPPHSTHILQPLDVVCFQPLKHYHSLAIRDAVANGDSEFKKAEFLAVLDGFRRQTFKSTTIKAAFQRVGFVPFNPDIVINTLAEQQTLEETKAAAGNPTGADSDDEIDLQRTPRTVRQIHRFTVELLAEVDVPDHVFPPLWKLLKGATSTSIAGGLALKRLADSEAAQKARAVRSKVSARRIMQGGMVTADEARERVISRREKDKSKEDARLDRIHRRARMDWQECGQLAAVMMRECLRAADRGQLRPWLRGAYGIEY